MAYDCCDVAYLSNPANREEGIPQEDFCCYDLVDHGLKLGALSLVPAKKFEQEFMRPGTFRPTGHGMVLRGKVAIPSPLGYVEKVRLFEENTKKFVAVSNVHRQAILILCGAAALARLEQCRKMDISAWITTGANIQPIVLPVRTLAHLHDWTDIEPEAPEGPRRAAYIEEARGQFFLRVASRNIPAGAALTDANTNPITQAPIILHHHDDESYQRIAPTSHDSQSLR